MLLPFLEEAIGQDLSDIHRKDPIKVTGGFSATGTAYSASGIPYRRDPFYWLLSANINFDVLGVFIPFSATVSQQNRSFTQPFNMYGLSPSYKSVTVHVGYRSMQFSSYTLSGNIFLGAGIEIAPPKSLIKYSGMYGRFAKAVSSMETDGVVSGEPAFERWGYGSKITIGKTDRNVDLIFFKAKDQYLSIPGSIADSFGLKPAENFVVGLNTKQSITKQLMFDLEYALSAYSTNTRVEGSETENYKYANHLGFLFTPNISSQFNKAISANLSYAASLYQIRLSYRRIDPEYKTMGSAFLNNDLEDISGNIGWRMLKNKMNISVGGGLQRNNLDNSLASRMSRFIGSLNWAYVVNKKLNVNARYSNFSSGTLINNQMVSGNQLGLNQNIDSLNYNQVTNSAGAGINYNTGSENIKHVWFSNGNYQKANDSQKNNSVFYNIISGYQLGFIPAGLNITFSANYNNSSIKNIDSRSLGPNLALSKLLFKKSVRSTLGITHLKTYSEGSLTGTNSVFRFSNSYKKGKHQSITMDLTYLIRTVEMGTGNSFSELRGSIIYGYTF